MAKLASKLGSLTAKPGLHTVLYSRDSAENGGVE